MKNKKGMTLKTIIEIIGVIFFLLISSGFLYSALKPDEQLPVDKCHYSVVTKASVPDFPGLSVSDLLLLECETQKICIVYSTSDNCDDSYLGETYTEAPISRDNAQGDINRIVAEKLKDCWWMMGEGKYAIYPEAEISKSIRCNLCTRIAFGKDLKEDIKVVRGTQAFLRDNTIPNSDLTYWQYITNSQSNYIEGYDSSKDSFETDKQKVIIFSEIGYDSKGEWIGRVAGGVAGAIIGSFVPGPGWVIGAGIGGKYIGDVGNKIHEYFTGMEPGARIQQMSLTNFDIDTLKAAKCTSFEGYL